MLKSPWIYAEPWSMPLARPKTQTKRLHLKRLPHSLVYSYFEKGCRKKCTRQSRKVLWVFLVHCFSKKFQTIAREAVDVCLRVLKESNKSRFDSYSVRNGVLIISHITFWDCRVHSFSDNLFRNSCKQHCSYLQSTLTPGGRRRLYKFSPLRLIRYDVFWLLFPLLGPQGTRGFVNFIF